MEQNLIGNGKCEAEVRLIIEDCAQRIALLKLTTDRYEALRGLSAIAGLLVVMVSAGEMGARRSSVGEERTEVRGMVWRAWKGKERTERKKRKKERKETKGRKERREAGRERRRDERKQGREGKGMEREGREGKGKIGKKERKTIFSAAYSTRVTLHNASIFQLV